MTSFHHHSSTDAQWQIYQRLELIPIAVERSPQHWSVLAQVWNRATGFVAEKRSKTLGAKYLERCMALPVEARPMAIATEIVTPSLMSPTSWLFDGNFDGVTRPAPKFEPSRRVDAWWLLG